MKDHPATGVAAGQLRGGRVYLRLRGRLLMLLKCCVILRNEAD